MNQLRARLDMLLALDAGASVVLGLLALLAPHGIWTTLFTPQLYNPTVHETLRLYGCLKLACGWIVWHLRNVDDGVFRRHVCEALTTCYTLQALAVLRAQTTSSSEDATTPTSGSSVPQILNWTAAIFLLVMAGCYASFRFGKGGSLIKLYELPTSGNLR